MATNNALNVGLSGASGTGSFAGTNSPTFTTPNLGTPDTLVLTNATGDQLGTTTNDNAAAGHVGEVISSLVSSGSAVALTTAITANVTSISLTAGDWDVWGIVGFDPNPATTASAYSAGISLTSATFNALSLSEPRTAINGVSFTAGAPQVVSTGVGRISLSGTTTVYLIAVGSFAVNTNAAYGYIIARRRR